MTDSDRPFSQACENNKGPILAVLKQYLSHVEQVLEVGSGTGQHAVYFAKELPQLVWQCSDRAENLAGISAWLDWAKLPNTPPPHCFDVNDAWPLPSVSALFTANTLHIMSWQEVEAFFAGMAQHLKQDALLCVYGPFNYKGAYTSESNAEFDQWLKLRNAHSGIRDFEKVDALAQSIGLRLLDDVAMPANNRCLVWKKLATKSGS